MSDPSFERVAADLLAGREGAGVKILKRSPVRVAARVGDAFLKVFPRASRRAQREARAIREAKRRGIPVPVLLSFGDTWLATQWLEGRPATREDLPAILDLAERMHASGMLHGDFHLGNLILTPSGLLLTDLQRTRFPPWVPGPLRRRELGYLAYSLGEPLPQCLAEVRFWCDRRAHRHWRSRTRRCVIESGGFTRFQVGSDSGFRRRDADPEKLVEVLRSPAGHEVLKSHTDGDLYRVGEWILKQHRSSRVARRAWVNGHGLEARGIGTGLPVAWAGRWLVMADAGGTVTDWVEARFESAEPAERAELADTLADLLANLHRRGIYHADLKANNVAWVPGRDPRLLDYGRVRFGRTVPRRRRIKNLAQLNAALPDMVPGALRERAFYRYTAQSGFRGDSVRLRARVIAVSLRRRHLWHGC